MKTTEHNGWKNRQTWNVMLWINNDEPLYRAAVDFVRRCKAKGKTRGIYARFIRNEGMQYDKTPDGIAWLGTRLDYTALNEAMLELDN